MSRVNFKEIVSYAKMLQSEYDEVKEEHSKLDMEITDVLHYIEFNNFNAVQGYKLAKMLKDITKRRREVKKTETQLDIILNNTISNVSKKGIKINNIEKEEYCNERYTPRVLVDLFKYGVK